MKKRITIAFILSTLLVVGCAKEEACSSGSPNIIGAQCNDGTSSSATGSGACSHHGGVDYWKCKE
ncbi:MAG: hypothetical protein KDF60_19100 [Calditrichaeota bacterium]|nr:hypothetical protein [Calditrichota bacterium]